MKKKLALKAAAFALLFFALLAGVSKLVTVPADYRNYQWIAGFYEEPEDKLDAVYIGGSNVYAFWAAPLAWEHYGIAVYPYACNSQPLAAARYLIEEARKTQPDALYIVSVNGLNVEPSENVIHYLVDYLPPSRTKLDLIQYLSGLGGFSGLESLEFYFPLIRYHSRWSALSKNDFHYTLNGLKGGSVYSSYLKTATDISESFRSTTRRQKPADDLQRSLESLLAYCDAEQVNVLFVTSPQARTDESTLAQYNAIHDLVQSHGYPVVNMMESLDEIGLDLTHDYYNERHTNLHGAVKITDYLANYLVENYQFQDKRGDASYSDWELSYDNYVEEIAPYALDVEYCGASRDYSLAAPELSKPSVNGAAITLKWKASAGADGYQIYRKTEQSGWTPLPGRVGPDTLSYVDENCKAGETYTYTVIAYRENGGDVSWGKYDFKGVSAAAVLDAPRLEALSGEENNVTLSWEEVDGADGYAVYRRIPAKSWVKVADVEQELAYTDSAMLADMPYEYRVRAYYLEDDAVKWGSYSERRLWLPELSGPQVSAGTVDGVPTLEWEGMEGITGYSVSRKREGGDWEQIAEQSPANSAEFRDITAQAGVRYAYQVTGYLAYGKDTHRYTTETPAIEAQGEAKVRLDPPEILFGRQVGSNIRLVWEPVDDATAYRIYRRAEGSDVWTVVSESTAGNTYQQKQPKAGTYTYAVQSLRVENGWTYYGDFQPDMAKIIINRIG